MHLRISPCDRIIATLPGRSCSLTSCVCHSTAARSQAPYAAQGPSTRQRDFRPHAVSMWGHALAPLGECQKLHSLVFAQCHERALGHQSLPFVRQHTMGKDPRSESLWRTTSTALVGYHDWPGLAQVFHLERHVTTKARPGQCSDGVYRVTSLHPEQAEPKRLLSLVRQHWQIERRSNGSAMSRSLSIAPQCDAVASLKSWPRSAIPIST
jgi:hypothetical protein